jgi:hypothetical protein
MKFKENDLVMSKKYGLVTIVVVDHSDDTYKVKRLDEENEHTGWAGGDDIRAMTLAERTVCAPESLLAKYLIGKKVIFADSYASLEAWDDEGENPRVLVSAASKDEDGDPSEYPFRVLDEDTDFSGDVSDVDEGDTTPYYLVAALPSGSDGETIEVTMEEVCAKFGKNVKIKKEN